VINTLKTQALEGLKNAQPNDRLHLVTHSWGTVILFDLLFASRWDDEKVPGHDDGSYWNSKKVAQEISSVIK